MPFHIHPLQEFLVRPALPAELERLPELGLNLMWSWNNMVRAVFRRLDSSAWRAANHNPVVMLGQLPQETLERASKDPRYLAIYRRACEIHDAYMSATPTEPSDFLVAYFSMEYGLLDCMPIYSGGLGVLSGDHLKAASDMNLPLVGVGLLYQRGFMRQHFDADGWQQEHTPTNDFYSLPISLVKKADGSDLVVDVQVGHRTLYLKVWQVSVGRVKLYLMDSNIKENADPLFREITSQLYSGGHQRRVAQEIALGIGGLRVLKELGLKPSVYHMNEGHSAFLSVERIRVLMQEQGLSFEEALEASRNNNLFTTHTPVPAGIDLFDGNLVREFLEPYCQQAGIPFEKFLALGRRDGSDHAEPFSMAVTAITASSYRNGVSKLHGIVSQHMWDALWPNLPAAEVPISAVTNGVHLPTWVNGDLANIYDQYLEPEWRDGASAEKAWEQIDEIPDAEIWEAHRRRKRRMITFLRKRAVAAAEARNAPVSEVKQLSEVLEQDALTIGFARRFATYKRATLLFRDIDRLKNILTDSRRPVQIVISGKAHPQDVPGKKLIQQIIQHARDPELSNRILFVEDYGIQVARELFGGVDIWLNTPRRGEEACGTSGMKAGMNGVLNLSILDGWFDEAQDHAGGWAIGDRQPYRPELDESDAASIYSLLEHEIVPLYYEDREHGMPLRWMNRVKESLKLVSENFDCQRMIGEYKTTMYEPAHKAYKAVADGKFQAARDRVEWNRKVHQAWPRVAILSHKMEKDLVMSGSEVKVSAEVELAGLDPEDVKVEAVIGHVGPSGDLDQAHVMELKVASSSGSVHLFEKSIVPNETGRLGLALRISSNHFSDPMARPVNTLMKWAG